MKSNPMTHILITDLREIRYITGKIESVPLDPEKDTLPFDREEDRETVLELIIDQKPKNWDLTDVEPGIYQVPVEVEVVCGHPMCDGGCTNRSHAVARLKSSEPKEDPQGSIWREVDYVLDKKIPNTEKHKILSEKFTITRNEKKENSI